MSLRVVSVLGNSHWCTASREIALLEVGPTPLPRQSGHRSPEESNAAWVRGKAVDSCCRQVGTRSLSAIVRALAPRSSSSPLAARTMRMPRLWKY